MTIVPLEIQDLVQELPCCNQGKISYEIVSGGLINTTWRVMFEDEPRIILQRINTNIFLDPAILDHNISVLQEHADRKISSNSALSQPFPTLISFNGQHMIKGNNNDYYRAFKYVSESYSMLSPSTAESAYEASKQFGYFAAFFSDLDVSQLATTIPNFHNLQAKYDYFLSSLHGDGIPCRIEYAQDAIAEIQSLHYICHQFNEITSQNLLPTRTVHHDAKVANMLFHVRSHKGLCVVDLDTTMPGLFLSDVGDLLRTSLCPYDEEETNFEKIQVRLDYFEAVMKGYLEYMGPLLTPAECQRLVFAGELIIFMQAVRFLSDFLRGDVYYRFSHDLHNYHRACNQLYLLRSYRSKKSDMQAIVDRLVAHYCA